MLKSLFEVKTLNLRSFLHRDKRECPPQFVSPSAGAVRDDSAAFRWKKLLKSSLYADFPHLN